MIKSKLNLILIPAVIIVILCCSLFLFIVYIVIINNLSNLADYGIISTILFLSYLGVFPSIMMLTIIRNYHIKDEHLEVRYLFGLITNEFQYKDLTLSDYRWSTRGLLIELPNGDQLTIGIKQYKNFDTIKEALEKKIDKESINVKHTTKFTRIMFVIGGVILTFLVITLSI